LRARKHSHPNPQLVTTRLLASTSLSTIAFNYGAGFCVFFKLTSSLFYYVLVFFSKIPRNLVEERKKRTEKTSDPLYDDNKMQWSEGMEKNEKKEEKKGWDFFG